MLVFKKFRRPYLTVSIAIQKGAASYMNMRNDLSCVLLWSDSTLITEIAAQIKALSVTRSRE